MLCIIESICSVLLDILSSPIPISYHQMKGLIQHKEAVNIFWTPKPLTNKFPGDGTERDGLWDPVNSKETHKYSPSMYFCPMLEWSLFMPMERLSISGKTQAAEFAWLTNKSDQSSKGKLILINITAQDKIYLTTFLGYSDKM